MTRALPSPEDAARDAPRDPASAGAAIAAPLARELGRLLETALNREIAASTAAADVLAELDGASFAIDVSGAGVRCVLRAEGERVAVLPGLAEGASGASATLRATPFDLLRLMRAADLAGLKGTGAVIEGSPEVAERFAALLKLARPDVEDALSRFVGDVPAHQLASAARGALDWLARAADALRMNTAEFLQEESRALPAPLEAQGFYADVEKLRDDVERAAARLARLERVRRA
jgi:ubiquinone biosynthesis protein UbiJ